MKGNSSSGINLKGLHLFLAIGIATIALAHTAFGSSGALSVVRTILIPNSSTPATASLNPSGTLLYISDNYGGAYIHVISTATNTTINAIGPNPSGLTTPLVFMPNGTRAYAAMWAGSVIVLGVQSNSIIDTIPMNAAGGSLSSIAINPSGTLVYVANQDNNTISVISTKTNNITGTITGVNDPVGISFNPSGTILYVADYNSNEISMVSMSTNSVTGTIRVDPGPRSIAISPSDSFAYVPYYIAGSSTYYGIDIVNLVTNSVEGPPISNVGSPSGVTFNPSGAPIAYVYGVSTDVYAINTISSTLFADEIPVIGGSGEMSNLALNPSGTLGYVADSGGGDANVFTLLPLPTAYNPNANAIICEYTKYNSSSRYGLCNYSPDPYIIGAASNPAVGQNVWGGADNYTQELYSYGPGNWFITGKVNSNWGGVETYPNIGFKMTGRVDSFSSITSSFNVTIPKNNYTAAWAAYDLWFNSSPHNEVMIQVNITAPSWYYCAANATATFDGMPWHLCVFGSELVWKPGTNDSNMINRKSGVIDIKSMIVWLEHNGYLQNNVTWSSGSFGYEVCDTHNHTENFTVNNFTWSATYDPYSMAIFIASNHSSTDVGKYIYLTNTVTGGTPPYTYAYSGPSQVTFSGNTATASVPGTYYITENVQDAQDSNSISNFVALTFNARPSFTLFAPETSTLDSGQSVTFANAVTGGTPPYTYAYAVNDMAGVTITGNTIKFVDPGTYSVHETVTDWSGDMANTTNAIITVNPALSAGPITPASPAISAGQPITLSASPSGGSKGYVYYVPITLTNGQGIATAANLQVMLNINSLKYVSYIDANWTNVEFTDGPASGNAIYAWVESNATDTSTNTMVWVRLHNTIPANGNDVIYMDFMPSGILSASGPTGEAPQLSPSYGEYDDGAYVFAAYFNGDTSNVLFSSPGGYIVSKATSQPYGSKTINAIEINGYDGTVPSFSYDGSTLPNSALIAEANVRDPSAQTDSDSGLIGLMNNASAGSITNGISTNMGYSGEYFEQAFLSDGALTTDYNPAGIATSSWVYSSVSYNGPQATSFYGYTAPQLYSTFGGYSGTISSNPLSGAQNLYLGVVSSTSSSYVVTEYYNWARARLMPPNGAMPDSTYGQESQGGWINPYDYQWYVISGSVAPTCTNSNAINGATSNTITVSPTATSTYAYRVSDFASTPESSCSAGDTATVNQSGNATTTISAAGSSGSSGGGGSGGGGGISAAASAVQFNTTVTETGNEITFDNHTIITGHTGNVIVSGYHLYNQTQYDTHTVKLIDNSITITINFITPTTAGISVNGDAYTVSDGQITAVNGPAYIDLRSISYLPIEHTVDLDVFTLNKYSIAANSTTTTALTNATTTATASIVGNNATTTITTKNSTTPAAQKTSQTTILSDVNGTSSSSGPIHIFAVILAIAVIVGILYYLVMRKRHPWGAKPPGMDTSKLPAMQPGQLTQHTQ